MENNNILIRLEKEILTQGREVEIKEYLTKEYVYTETESKDLIFFKEKNKAYNICHEKKVLKAIDINAQKAQIQQLRAIMPDLDIDYKEVNNQERECNMEGRNINAVAKAKITLKKIPELADTCYLESHLYSQQEGVLQIDLDEMEMVQNIDFSLNFQGNLNESVIKNKSIDVFTDGNLKEKYDTISRYHLEEEL